MQNRKMYATLVMGVAIAVAAPYSLADNCGNNDRTVLPSCVTSTGSPFTITNQCSYTVTIKIARASAKDSRVNINPGATVNNERPGNLFCCPRYNRCI